jgi:hypothetical protein
MDNKDNKSATQRTKRNYMKSTKHITTMTPVETSPDVVIGKSSDLVVQTKPEPVIVNALSKPVSKKPSKKIGHKLTSKLAKKPDSHNQTQRKSATIDIKPPTSVQPKVSAKSVERKTVKEPVTETKITETDTRSIASAKISKFFRSKKKKSRSRFIKRMCNDPALCIAFDRLTRQKINEHFNFFSSLRFISDVIQQIGETSANGFVKEVKFTNDDYSAYAVLKSSVTHTSDNLVYEFLAGQYMNYQCNYLPCFVETYGLFYYKDDTAWELFKDNKRTLPNEFTAGLVLQSSEAVDYAKACQNSRQAAILLQYIHGAKVLHSFISNSLNYIAYQMIYQTPYLLYQIYFALALLKSNFTHYDLHTSNVMLYEPAKGKYIEYVYHVEGGKEVRFRCPYLVKIIDYGRCFFKWSPEDIEKNIVIDESNYARNPTLVKKERIYVSSPDIYKSLCDEQQCSYERTDEDGKKHTYTCGKKYGFSWLDNPAKKTSLKYFISSSRSNMSHDLRLLYIVGQTLLRKKAHEFNTKNRMSDEIEASADIAELFKKVVYAVGLQPNQDHSGTRENKTSGLPHKIQNVVDAEKALRELVLDKKLVKINRDKYHEKKNRLGTLHIYSDGTQMKFEK